MNTPRALLSIFTLVGLTSACSPASPSDPGAGSAGAGSVQQSVSMACFTTQTGIVCSDVEDGDVQRARTRVEDFYPSACLDSDRDDDGMPDHLDQDDDSSGDSNDDSDAGVGDDSDDDSDGFRCERCNRGPGTQGDFRLDIEGLDIELDRGTVLSIADDTIEVPTPDGILVIVVNENTEFEDGQPTAGAEIRARGVISADGTHMVAERLKVLCPGAAPIEDDQVPEDAVPPSDGEGNVVL